MTRRADARGGRLVVASYNVHRCIGRDRRHDPGRVGAVLRELDADVIALQEVSTRSGGAGRVDQAEVLAGAAGMQAIRGPTLRFERGEVGNVLLARVAPERLARLDLTRPGREPRGAIDAWLKLGAVTLRVLATHLGLSGPERREQVRALLAELDRQPADTTVLLGDVNEWLPFGGAVRRLDRWFGRAPARRTFPARRPLLALDRVWVRPRAALAELTVHRSSLARVASDHLPVRCVLDLPSLGAL